MLLHFVLWYPTLATGKSRKDGARGFVVNNQKAG